MEQQHYGLESFIFGSWVMPTFCVCIDQWSWSKWSSPFSKQLTSLAKYQWPNTPWDTKGSNDSNGQNCLLFGSWVVPKLCNRFGLVRVIHMNPFSNTTICLVHVDVVHHRPWNAKKDKGVNVNLWRSKRTFDLFFTRYPYQLKCSSSSLWTRHSAELFGAWWCQHELMDNKRNFDLFLQDIFIN